MLTSDMTDQQLHVQINAYIAIFQLASNRDKVGGELTKNQDGSFTGRIFVDFNNSIVRQLTARHLSIGQNLIDEAEARIGFEEAVQTLRIVFSKFEDQYIRETAEDFEAILANKNGNRRPTGFWPD